MLLFQVETTDLIDKGLEITPGSATAYGALVIVLAVAVVFLWRKLASVEVEFRDVIDTALKLFERVSQRLEDQQNHAELLKDIRRELEAIKTNLQNGTS